MRLLLGAILVIALCLATVAAASAAPGLVVEAPQDGATIQGSSVTVTFHVTDFTIVQSTIPLVEAGKHPEANRPGEGHLHMMLDTQPLVIWDKSAPYTFENVAPGRHQLMVELANNDHSSLSPPVTVTISFDVAPGAAAAPTAPTPVVMPVTGRSAAPGAVSWLTCLAGLLCLAAAARLRRSARRGG